MSRREIVVELPNDNPFSESRPRGGRSGGASGGRPDPPRSRRVPQHYGDEPVEDEEDFGGRPGNVVMLPTENPFARHDNPRDARSGGQSNDRPIARGGNRARPRREVEQEDDEGRGITVLPTENPFARGGNRNSTRTVEPVYQPSGSEPEQDEEEESDYVPPPPPHRANTVGNERVGRAANTDRPQAIERRRMGNPRNQLRSVDPPEDDRLVVSWVDEELVSPVRPASNVTSESESYFPRPPRPSSVSPRPDNRLHPHNRDHHHHDHHHSHHDHHCRQCHRLAIPTWQPPFPLPPADWSGYGGSPYSPAPPYPFPRPLYANIRDLPSLLDQCRAPYPPVPVPPTTFLRDLRTQVASGTESPLSELPALNPLDTPANPEKWKQVLEFLATNQASGVMTLLKNLEFSPAQVDRIFRRLTNVVQVRFAELQGNEIVNRVHVVPRGRLAMGIIISESPKMDVDLVIPSDFILRRWNVTASETDDLRPKTIADALELNPASINRGEVEITKLQWVFRAIWEQLNGSADGFIFPGGREEAERYLPKDWCALYKDHIQDSNRLRLQVNSWPGAKVVINVFVKVSLSLYGQDMIVGVDQTSARSGMKYQLIKTLRIPGVPLSEATLSPNLRTAIQLLCWSQIILGVVPGSSPIRTSHFHLALAALQQLDPSDKLYIPPSDLEPFSLYGVIKAAAKIIQFVGRAYMYKPPVAGIPDGYPFPLSSCTIMDALSIQASSSPTRLVTTLACLGATLPQFAGLEKTLAAFSLDVASLTSQIAGVVAGAIGDEASGSVVDAATGIVAEVVGTGATGGDSRTSFSEPNSDAAKGTGSPLSGAGRSPSSPKPSEAASTGSKSGRGETPVAPAGSPTPGPSLRSLGKPSINVSPPTEELEKSKRLASGKQAGSLSAK